MHFSHINPFFQNDSRLSTVIIAMTINTMYTSFRHIASNNNGQQTLTFGLYKTEISFNLRLVFTLIPKLISDLLHLLQQVLLLR